jgi:integrase
MAVKRAKTVERKQFDQLLKIVQKSEHPLRDEVALRLSFSAGLRAGEIALLRWENNLLNPVGEVMDVIHITSDVGKRAVERTIPIEPSLRMLLKRLRRQRPEDEYVFYALHNNVVPQVPVLDAKGKPVLDDEGQPRKRDDPDWVPGKVSPNAVVQWFKRLYAQVGFQGCTSHSGRRTFITSRARMANQAKCSIRDVQELAGHRRLDTTAEYIDTSEFQKDLVALNW